MIASVMIILHLFQYLMEPLIIFLLISILIGSYKSKDRAI